MCGEELSSTPSRSLNGVDVCSPGCCSVLINRDIALANGDMYDADYFLRGKETGKSLYENYRWMPELTIPMVKNIVSRIGINTDHIVLDFGCARGYTVRALREIGIDAYGVDLSQWAIENCDPAVNGLVSCTSEIPPGIDWVIMKDVLEHVPRVADTIGGIMDAAQVGVFAVIPLSAQDNMPYIIPDYELDITHIHRLTLASWARMFIRHGWSVECRYRLRGVKDNYHGWLSWIRKDYLLWRHGNGFIIARRI